MDPGELTYAEVGRTRGDLPPGFHHLRRRAVLGSGAERFQRAAEELFRWQLHQRARVTVESVDAVATVGTRAVLRLGIGRLALRAPVRVVYVVDEPDRQGFAYGTLPGHPECGEESFVVGRHPDGSVTLEITAFSRPATRLARAAGPLGRAVQRWVTGRYLRAL